MPKSLLPTKCPRCQSDNTTHLETMEVSTCLNCDLDWWWSKDDGEIVTSGASQERGRIVMISHLTKPCIGCHEPSIVELDKDKLKAWEQGEHVQNVWPEKSADERELLITGTHGTCWDKMFGEAG